MIENGLKQKLEHHKRWLEDQIDKQEKEHPNSGDSSQNNSEDYDVSPRRDQELSQDEQSEDLGYYMVSAKDSPNGRQEVAAHTKPSIRQKIEEDEMRADGAYSNEASPSPTKETFKPLRNHKSGSEAKLVGSLPDQVQSQTARDYSPVSKRWDILYMKNQQLLDQRKKLMEEKRDEDDVDPECTFKPKINNKYTVESTVSFAERSKLWNEQREQKLLDVRKRDENNDLKGCTFKPNVLQQQQQYQTQLKHNRFNTNSNASASASKGVDKFLRRQAVARQNKEEKDLIMANPMAKYALEGKKGYASALSTHHSRKVSTNQDLIERNPNLNDFDTQQTSRGKYNEVPFGYAVKQLHNELHKFDIKYE